jgi:hypothetical protein
MAELFLSILIEYLKGDPPQIVYVYIKLHPVIHIKLGYERVYKLNSL